MTDGPRQLDVRDMPPRERHPLIFATFDRLAPGEALVLVNDHDPKPLYYQLQAERPGQMAWEPEEEGPERWVVRIKKVGGGHAQDEALAESARPTEPLREEHRDLMPHIDRLRELAEATERDPGASATRLGEAVEFLQGHLLVHAQAEERVLYPAIADLMGAPQATATMSRDHVEIERLTGELAALRRAFDARTPTPEDLSVLRRLAYGLYAIVRLHLAKEEDVYLPLLDARMTAGQASSLFAAMARAAAEARRVG